MDLKPALTIDEQISLLKKRGMTFVNEQKAKLFLSENNYYRLNIYFHLKKYEILNDLKQILLLKRLLKFTMLIQKFVME